MSTLPIYLYGNDVLKKKAKKVTEVTDADVKLVKNMFETMHESNGIGLAANQVGELKQILVVDISDMEAGEGTKPMAVINPEIVDFLLALRKEMKNRLDLDLNRELETPKSISGDLVAMTSEGWKIMLNKDLGAEKEVEMLQTVLDQNIGKEKRADLEYVDLRIEGKVYYKLKSAASEEVAEKTKN